MPVAHEIHEHGIGLDWTETEPRLSIPDDISKAHTQIGSQNEMMSRMCWPELKMF